MSEEDKPKNPKKTKSDTWFPKINNKVDNQDWFPNTQTGRTSIWLKLFFILDEFAIVIIVLVGLYLLIRFINSI